MEDQEYSQVQKETILRHTGKNISRTLPMAVVVGMVLAVWLLNTPSGLTGKAHAVGYAVCHQIVERSFMVDGQPIALCARCTGMYVGAMLGLFYQLFLGRRRTEWPEMKKLGVLAFFVLAWGIDGVNSAAQLFLRHNWLYEPNNTLRLITGMGIGLAMASVLQPTFNQSVWRKYDPRPYLETWVQFGGLLALGAVATTLILTENPAILLPASLVGALGVMVLLTMVYTMLLLVIFKKENQIDQAGQLLPWLLGGFLIALLQIGLIDIGRFLLTGTWEGFHLVFG